MLNKLKITALLTAALAAPSYANSPPPVIPLPPIPPGLGAGGVSLSRGITLAEFTRLVLEDVLKKQFVLPSSLLAATQQVGVSTAKLSPSSAEQILTRVLKDNGFILQPGPVYYVIPVPPDKAGPTGPDLDWISYRPKNRPVSYFASALPAVFPDAKFSFDRAGGGGKSAPGSGDQAGLDVFFVNVSKTQHSELLRLIETLDVPVPRVVLRAALVEVSADNRAGAGLKIVASALSGRLGINLDASSSGSAFTLKTGALDFAVTAFDGDSRFKTLSFPTLSIEHAQQAKFQVGSKIPIQNSTTQDGVTTRTVEYRDVGTIVTVVPQVVGDSVSVSIQLELSDVGATATGTSTAPTILTRNLSTQTTLKSGQAVLLGNLQSSRQSQSDNRLFGFRLSTDRATTNNELVLILYAEIEQPGDAADGATAPAPAPEPGLRDK